MSKKTCADCMHCEMCRWIDETVKNSTCDFFEEWECRPHGQCNQCRYYEGVHGVQGHAPCLHWNIGGVMWNDYCSRFEKEGDEK